MSNVLEILRSMKLLGSFFLFHISTALFSVYDDLHATPAFVLNNLSDGRYIQEDEVPLYIDSIQRQSNVEVEIMKLYNQTYVCAVPVLEETNLEPRLVKWGDNELQRAKERGIELLAPLSKGCLFYRKGWWTYSFCYGREIRQYHVDKPFVWGDPPPNPEDATMNFVLGQFGNSHTVTSDSKELTVYDKTKIEVKPEGEKNSLSYLLGQGTLCEITGKDRTIEIQFFCNPALRNQDRIVWIKEVRSCHYLLAIETSRLCQDVVFVPPKKLEPYKVDCKAVVRNGETPVVEKLDPPKPLTAGIFLTQVPENNDEFDFEPAPKEQASFSDDMDKTLNLVLMEVSRMIKNGEFTNTNGQQITMHDKFSTIMSIVDLDGKSVVNVKIQLQDGELGVSIVPAGEVAKFKEEHEPMDSPLKLTNTEIDKDVSEETPFKLEGHETESGDESGGEFSDESSEESTEETTNTILFKTAVRDEL